MGDDEHDGVDAWDAFLVAPGVGESFLVPKQGDPVEEFGVVVVAVVLARDENWGLDQLILDGA